MKRIIRIVFFAILLAGLGGVAYAQGEPQKDSEGFEPVNGDMMQRGESIPASRLVGAAYGFIFAAIAVWAASVVRRTRRLEDEVDAMKKKLDTRG